jgi:hypothetical protein
MWRHVGPRTSFVLWNQMMDVRCATYTSFCAIPTGARIVLSRFWRHRNPLVSREPAPLGMRDERFQ